MMKMRKVGKSGTSCGGILQEETAELLEELGVPVEEATRRET